jgi:cytochrome c oxidase assembly protein subunit 15
MPLPEPIPAPAPWRHRFALVIVAATLCLIFIGGLVTSTESGLAVPDWPLSYGMLMPPMVGGIFYEHGHRMAASAVGFLTLVMAIWTARSESRPGVRKLAWAALGTVIAQGLLGGLTVILLLPPAVSVSHACLAQTFFCLTIAIAYATSAEWQDARPRPDPAGLRGASIAAVAVVFAQLLMGALMRHTDAGLAIPDFPLAFGRLIPPFEEPGVAIHFAHRAFALAVVIAIANLAVRASRCEDPRLARPAFGLIVLVMVQVSLGAATVLTRKAVTPTTTHVAVGAAILGLTFFLALRGRRLLRPAPRPVAAAERREVAA